ncbi:dammarenediol II synthase-like protein, partial [Tanacetum coccineum]
MWKLKIAEGNDPYLFSTNNFVGRQTWEFDPDAGTNKEKQEVENARQYFVHRQKEGYQASSDLLMMLQMTKENGIDLLSIPSVRLKEEEEVNYEAVTTAVKKAVRLVRAIQAKDGHWPAENAGPLFLTAPLLIVLYISGNINTHLTIEHKIEMKRFIYNHQNEDGGWGFHIECHSTMMGSVLNYISLRLLGEEPDDKNGALDRGRKWILDHGGATSIPSWGKVYLSVLGVYDWEGCNPMPPEFWIFPESFPFHPAKMWCYCRATYMPMSYLYGRKIHGPITDLLLLLREEIHCISYDEINWNKQRHNCCKADLFYPHTTIQDLLWDGLHYISEPLLKYWPLTKLRERSLKRTVELMRYSAYDSRYITMACVDKFLQMMCWWSLDTNGDEFKHHLARVPDYLWLGEDGMKMQTAGSQLWDCAFATQAIISSNMPEEYGDTLRKANFFLKESQIKDNPSGDFTKLCRKSTKGGWAFIDQDNGWPVSDCTAEALKCLLLLSQMPDEVSGEKTDNERLYEAVNF